MDSSTTNNIIDEVEFRNYCEKMMFDPSSDRKNDDEIRRIFSIFDASTNDGRLIGREFGTFQKWAQILTRPKSALIIVDVQNDFINGSLPISKGPAGQDPLEIIPNINNLLNKFGDKFDLIVYTLDWHPENHVSFVENVRLRKLEEKFTDISDFKPFQIVKFVEPTVIEQKLWPKHCVQNTPGAELHANLNFVQNGVKVFKGENPNVDSYSAFFDNQKLNKTSLDGILKTKNITDVYVCGLAYDVCVADTCYDALELGYKTVLLKNCTKGLDTKAMTEVDKEIRRRDGLAINGDADTVESLLTGRRIPWCWGRFVANFLTK